ncbi:ABC transporter substrate-binding protein [Desulfococcaceae bacterium HSG7]|nr:ABC transporter substrate-binding protein [Desulfococcaceae bacterium HSG7]
MQVSVSKKDVSSKKRSVKSLRVYGFKMLLACCTIMLTCPAYATEPVKIAAIFAKTGKAGLNNIPFIQVAELSVAEINKQGGLLGKPVQLIFIDNKSTPIGAAIAADEAVQQKVTAVVGANWSSHSMAMAPILKEAGIPMITPTSTHPMITPISDYIFRACYTDAFQGKVMAQFAYRELGARTAAVMKCFDQEYSMTLAKLFTESFKKSGGKLLFDGGYKSKAVDFKSILEKVKKLKPDVVFVPGYPRDSGLLVKQAASMGIKTTFLSGDGWSQIYKVAGDAVNGSYHATHWHPDVPLLASVNFCETYKKKYGSDIPSHAASVVYDAFMVLADAIRRAGTTADRSKIRDALHATRGFQGITGTLEFDANGDPKDKAVIVIKLEKGVSTYFKKIKP